jgi:hypothetical protein
MNENDMPPEHPRCVGPRSYTTLDWIFYLVYNGADRILWHMTLMDIEALPEVTPAMVIPRGHYLYRD